MKLISGLLTCLFLFACQQHSAEPTFETETVAPRVYLNELVSDNSGGHKDPDFNNRVDWIELYNASDKPVDLGGHYLTDNLLSGKKWPIPSGIVVPANGFLVIYCDHLNRVLKAGHTNFSLNGKGEGIYLLNSSLVVVDQLVFDDGVDPGNSYGRAIDGGSREVQFLHPTPGKTNVR